MADTILLFDLGGVLVDLGDPAGEMDLDMSNERFWELWLSSPLVQQFETGKLNADEFVVAFAPQVGVDDAADFAERIRGWRLPMFDGIEGFLATLTPRTDIALLSNTNEIHWAHVQSQTDIFEIFNKLFLSFETGNAKPKSAAFLDVVDHFACAPEQILFLDDNAGNVAAAQVVGLRSKQTRGLAQVKAAVDEFLA